MLISPDMDHNGVTLTNIGRDRLRLYQWTETEQRKYSALELSPHFNLWLEPGRLCTFATLLTILSTERLIQRVLCIYFFQTQNSKPIPSELSNKSQCPPTKTFCLCLESENFIALFHYIRRVYTPRAIKLSTALIFTIPLANEDRFQ